MENSSIVEISYKDNGNFYQKIKQDYKGRIFMRLSIATSSSD